MEFDDVNEKDVSDGNIDNAAIEDAITKILNAVGEDPQREGLAIYAASCGAHVS